MSGEYPISLAAKHPPYNTTHTALVGHDLSAFEMSIQITCHGSKLNLSYYAAGIISTFHQISIIKCYLYRFPLHNTRIIYKSHQRTRSVFLLCSIIRCRNSFYVINYKFLIRGTDNTAAKITDISTYVAIGINAYRKCFEHITDHTASFHKTCHTTNIPFIYSKIHLRCSATESCRSNGTISSQAAYNTAKSYLLFVSFIIFGRNMINNCCVSINYSFCPSNNNTIFCPPKASTCVAITPQRSHRRSCRCFSKLCSY